MCPIDPLRIDAVQVPHAFRELRLGRFDDQVIMIGHQTIGMTAPIEAPTDVRIHVQKHVPVGVIEKDIRPGIPSGSDVIHSPQGIPAVGDEPCQETTKLLYMALQDLTPI